MRTSRKNKVSEYVQVPFMLNFPKKQQGVCASPDSDESRLRQCWICKSLLKGLYTDGEGFMQIFFGNPVMRIQTFDVSVAYRTCSGMALADAVSMKWLTIRKPIHLQVVCFGAIP